MEVQQHRDLDDKTKQVQGTIHDLPTFSITILWKMVAYLLTHQHPVQIPLKQQPEQYVSSTVWQWKARHTMLNMY